MKTKEKKSPQAVLRGAAMLLAAHPGLRLCLSVAAAFGGGVLLAGICLLDSWVPAALALTAALPFGLAQLASYGGAAVGYLLHFGFSEAVVPLAAGFLIVSEACIFCDLLPRDRRWFMPCTSAGLFALVGFVYSFEPGFRPETVSFLLARIGLLGLCCAAFSAGIRQGSRRGRCALALCLLAGCSSVILPGELPLSVPLAAAAVFWSLHTEKCLLTAVCCGLILDLTLLPGSSLTALLTFAALVVQKLPIRYRPVQAAAFFACALAEALFSGQPDEVLLAGVALGLLPAVPIPTYFLSRRPAEGELRPEEASALTQAAAVLEQIERQLSRPQIREAELQSAEIFDPAAEQVCRSCVKWNDCWQIHGAETYRELSGASAQILQCGAAKPEDLPESFLQRCVRSGEFLAAVNAVLEQQLCRRQYRNRLTEMRQVVSDQYRALARLLLAVRADHPGGNVPAVYAPELGYRARGVRGSAVSGDRGASFTHGEWYYVLLCDGMGTGPDAARESLAAVELLSRLICAEMDAQDALQMLNGVYILQGDGGFSTVDLLQISLVTGDGFLHKWGAAPSYLKYARTVKRLGTGTPPPGLDRGSCQCLPVSLQKGELLVLASDGADPEKTEQYLRGSIGLSPREMAAGILGCGAATDDCTAAVLRLRAKGTKVRQ